MCGELSRLRAIIHGTGNVPYAICCSTYTNAHILPSIQPRRQVKHRRVPAFEMSIGRTESVIPNGSHGWRQPLHPLDLSHQWLYIWLSQQPGTRTLVYLTLLSASLFSPGSPPSLPLIGSHCPGD